ncbi:decapping and exoribonuclease protein-like [Ambystoma mexicanum]|uniref:decapping and exoribonuclease protein-like n=1 Tax=Ambystoma mexicanum TaxID=8296 RepID=UPI0037E75D45
MFRGEPRQGQPRGSSLPSMLRVRHQHYKEPFHFPSYRPREIGCVSVNAEGRFPNDAQNKRYLRLDARPIAMVQWDLMDGYYDRYIKMNMDNDEGRLHALLRWCLASGQQLRAATEGVLSDWRPLNFDFVARRGHLAKVFLTPYADRGWEMAVTLFLGTYFLLVEREEEPPSERAEHYNFMGHKFEHYMTSAKAGQDPNPSEVLNDNEAFFTVLKASLNSHSLLFSAEVDGQDINYQQKAPACYVELKTSQMRGDTRNVPSFVKLKWWAQSFLAGIPRIIVGFKKDKSTVVKCIMYDVNADGLRQTEDGGMNTDFWRPAVCMNFLDAFLSLVKEVVTEDNPEVVYNFSWKPGMDTVQYSVKRGQGHCFLLPEYIQSVRSRGPGVTEPSQHDHRRPCRVHQHRS